MLGKIKHSSTKSSQTAYIFDRFTLAGTILCSSPPSLSSLPSPLLASPPTFSRNQQLTCEQKEGEPRLRGWVTLAKPASKNGYDIRRTYGA